MSDRDEFFRSDVLRSYPSHHLFSAQTAGRFAVFALVIRRAVSATDGKGRAAGRAVANAHAMEKCRPLLGGGDHGADRRRRGYGG